MTEDITRKKLFNQIAQLQQKMEDLEDKMNDADEKEYYKFSLIYSSLGKQVSNLFTSLTRVRCAELEVERANAENGKPSSDNVAFRGTREDLLKELRMKKQIEKESINDELPNDEPEHAFDEPEDTIEPILQPTKKEDMKMKRALYGVY